MPKAICQSATSPLSISPSASVQPLAVNVETAAALVSLKAATIRIYIRNGVLRATRCGARLLIPMTELERLVREGAPSRPRTQQEVKQFGADKRGAAARPR